MDEISSKKPKIDSIKFPDMLSATKTNLVTDYDATLQNLKLLLLSEQGSLFGDPYFGLNLRHNIFEQNFHEIWDDLLIDKIYTCIAQFMPQLRVTRKDIKIERTVDYDILGRKLPNIKGTLSVSIRGMNDLTLETNLYNIVLFQNSK